MRSPIEVFHSLIAYLLFRDRFRKAGPGKVVESLSAEDRETLSNLKSDDISPEKARVEEYYMMGQDWEDKRKLLEYEEKMGFKPPPRKKYEP